MAPRKFDHLLKAGPEDSHPALLRTVYKATNSSAGLSITLPTSGSAGTFQLMTDPRVALLLGKCGFTFSINIPLTALKSIYLFSGFPYFSTFNVQSLRGNAILQVNDLANYAATVCWLNPLDEIQDDIAPMLFAATSDVKYGVNALNIRSFASGSGADAAALSIIANNNVLANPAGYMMTGQAAANCPRFVHNMNTDLAFASTAYVDLSFESLMHLPISAVHGFLYASESLVFTITLNGADKIAYNGVTNINTPSLNGNTKLTVQPVISNFALRQVSLADVSANDPIRMRLIKEMESAEGCVLAAENVDQSIMPCGTAAQGSQSVVIGTGRSQKYRLLKKVITAFLSPTTTDALVLGTYNRAVAPAVTASADGPFQVAYATATQRGAGYRYITQYQTLMNSSPLQPAALQVDRLQHWDWNRDQLKGSCLSGFGLFSANFCHIDNFTPYKACEYGHDLAAGFSLAGNDQYQVFWTRNTGDAAVSMSIMVIPVYQGLWVSKADGVVMV